MSEETLQKQIDELQGAVDGIKKSPSLPDHFHTGFDVSRIKYSDIDQRKFWITHTVTTPRHIVFATTGSYGGGGTSNAFTVTGVLSTDIVTAVIRASTTAVAIHKAVPTTDTITVTFSADPGASTTVDFIVSRATAGFGVFFINRIAPCYVSAFYEVHQTAGTDGSAVTLMLEKLTGTTALDSGSDVLSATLSLKATANTVQTGSLSATFPNRNLALGDRLALEDTGVLTSVANVTVFVELTLT